MRCLSAQATEPVIAAAVPAAEQARRQPPWSAVAPAAEPARMVAQPLPELAPNRDLLDAAGEGAELVAQRDDLADDEGGGWLDVGRAGDVGDRA